jgi:hypothetical protein
LPGGSTAEHGRAENTSVGVGGRRNVSSEGNAPHVPPERWREQVEDRDSAA